MLRMLQRSYAVSNTLICRKQRVTVRRFTTVGSNKNDAPKDTGDKKPESFERKPEPEKEDKKTPEFDKEPEPDKDDKNPKKYDRKVDPRDRQPNTPGDGPKKGPFDRMTNFKGWRDKFFNRQNFNNYRDAFARNGSLLVGLGFFTFYTILFVLEKRREKSKITHNVT